MTNRRSFCKAVSSLSLLFPLQVNLVANDAKTLSKDEVFSIFDIVQKLIFPAIKTLDIDALSYLKLILSHSKISKKDKDFLINGCLWLDNVSQKIYEISFINLDENRQNKIINLAIKDESWAESWIYDMLVFCSEAVFGDPIYGANIDENGWKWISHETGLPQPKTPFL
ncbi:Uncharacterised protein [Campylobacter hyointestinalis]|uniref:gluconate 2-dehydrogenase subunit 3 family protein n=1 Tax=Campylobacter hyointestinalis TaxID=198 RepID=UPI00072BA3BA|nr:gluconate 2-dehydrogenase subunit 3 family protein [Campylobacter hyointestinalis]PPB58058.1 hypothetical protein CDQ71_03840 [Campylobacter hyointestinalis subsp. hyointestinalis]QCU00728.1 gluconate 2-dehydrogenase subunit 3 family protein [Campylobacter hyointestinalis subsp. hyointestinalis]CUU76891.1 Uncharacterised protein [Campylobacter hyointestinalis subsp. hyointestinalis]CUU84362.1 Uncharacterised protein [Campylobacter hyointestinalis]